MGVSTPGADARCHIQWPSSSCSRGDPVSLSPTLPSAPWGSFGSTVSVRRRLRSSGTRARGRSSPVRRCLASPASAAPRLSGGPSLAGPSSRQAEALTRGAEPRSVAVRPVLVPPSTALPCPKALLSGAAACRPRPVRCGVPRRPSLPRQVWSRSRSCSAQAPLSPPSSPFAVDPRVSGSGWRGLEGVTVSLQRSHRSCRPKTTWFGCWLSLLGRSRFLSRVAAFGLRQRLPVRLGFG